MHMLNRLIRLLSLVINNIRNPPIHRKKLLQRHINTLNLAICRKNLLDMRLCDILG